ncbi:ImmA/IrrE family metallo-endopeptidase [Lacticaseibacillus paracasei]|uniref:XRE family transcriptional regulator n=1 Tax=Lacticaseibacillus paracasei TaxID=1597 RepID=UPI000E59E27F|nr:XRE family transcriptional regulator [Lacticaseibacillus paracasei]RHX74835.1 ImmA/IrrE family metallo-endopeptidase [Lacticaseibacillus paracasei]
MSLIRLSGHFESSKLSFLRRLKSESLAEVGKETGYSANYISMLERGEREPDFRGIEALARHFGVNHQFFLVNQKIPSFAGPVFFRKAAVLPKRKVLQAKYNALFFAYVEQDLDRELQLPAFKPQAYANTLSKFTPLSFDYVEKMAENVREDYDLGVGPITNMTLLVERMGIRVKFADLESEKVDAVTGWINKRPYIILNSRRKSSVRIRFNLAHELGHILLHSHYSESDVQNTDNRRTIESEAQHIAGAILMPAKGIALDMIRNNMNYLIQLKEHWKVSIQSLIYRGNQLGLISDSQALFLRQTIYRNGWREEEPLDDSIPTELPSFLGSAISFTSNGALKTLNSVAFKTGLNVDQASEVLGLKSDEKKDSGRFKLRVLK